VLTSSEPAAESYWTHLAVVYDANLDQLRLYVNGRMSAAQVGVATWKASGKLSIGRARWNGENTGWFLGGIDDVRAFSNALSDAQLAKVYDDVDPVQFGSWRFDDQSVRDSSWRNNPTTSSGPMSYVPGVKGQALQLDGLSAAANVQYWGASTQSSFTVSAWAKLTSSSTIQTVVGQDGSRMSGFALQYRPGLNRWVFSAPTQDADGALPVYAQALQPSVLNTWVHLTGVYDHAARQLRLYVDGELVGSRNGVDLWDAAGGLTIGRGKVGGQPAEHFSGAIDEVQINMGVISDSEIARQAT
jgi:hypothetical protein